jgi:hypothetical protein
LLRRYRPSNDDGGFFRFHVGDELDRLRGTTF